MMNLDLSGHRAIVTGASKGIGAACVRLLADHGAVVAFTGRDSGSVDALAGYRPTSGPGSVRGYIADMADQAETDAFLQAVDDEVGEIDIVVNNVGASPSRNFLYMSDQDWFDLFELNVLSAVRCTRHCLPNMRRQRWGRVVMVSSAAAFAPNPALIDYSATKAAMVATAKALASKYGPDGVLVNTIIPGYVRTNMWERAASEIAAANDLDVEAVFAERSRGIPLGRYGTSEEIANGVVFLCSDAASYINGTTLLIDGGCAEHV